MGTTRSIIVRNNFEFVHCWPDAPYEVRFLQEVHRHRAFTEVEIEVTHDDRELEFIMVQRRLQAWVEADKFSWPTQISCEMIADKIIKMLHEWYGTRNITCKVFEDNENGAKVVFMRD